MKEKITFGQLMQYADPETEPEIMIQIVVDDEVFAACDVGICDHVILFGGGQTFDVQLCVAGVLD